MARLFTSTISGAATVAATGFSASGSAAAIATSPTGENSIQITCSDNASTRLIRETITMPRAVDHFCKLILEIDTAPTSAIDLCSISNGSTVWRLRWTTSRTLQLFDSASTLLATSAAITVRTRATVEVSWKVQTTTTGLWTFRLNGTQVGTGSAANLGSIDCTEFICGKNVSTRAGFILYIDPEFGVNDSSGGSQNSWLTDVTPADPGTLASDGVGNATAVVSTTAPLTTRADGVSNATLNLTAATKIPLARVDGIASATLTVIIPIPVPLDRVDGIGNTTVRITAATQVPLARVDGIGNATAIVTTGAPLVTRADGVGNTTLRISAQTQIPLDRVDSVSGNSLALNAPTRVPLDRTDAIGNATLRITAATQVPLNRVDGVSSNALVISVSGAASLVLSRADGVNSNSLTVSAQTQVPLNRVDAICSTALGLTASTQTSFARVDGLSNAILAITAAAKLTLARIDGISGNSLDATAATRVPLDAVICLSNAATSLTATTQTSLANIASSNTSTLRLTAVTQVPLVRIDSVGDVTLRLITATQVSFVSDTVGTAALSVSVRTQLTFASVDVIGSPVLRLTFTPNFTFTSDTISTTALRLTWTPAQKLLPDLLFALITALRTDSDVVAMVGNRVYGLQVPDSETVNMPRAALVVRYVTLPMMYGTGSQNYGDNGIEVLTYGATPYDADRLWRIVHPMLKHLMREVHSHVLIHWARPISGPYPLRELDTDWPYVLSTWQVMAAEIALV